MTLFRRFSYVFLSFVFIFGIAQAWYLWIDVPSSVYQWCTQPYTIKMNTSWANTQAVDTKLFLSGYFSLLHPYIDFSTASLNGTFASYNTGIFSTLVLMTGMSTSGITAEYLYLNSYDSVSYNWSNVTLATLYLNANSLYTTWFLTFYFVDPNWNGDDSNISSGMNNTTQYVDVLSWAINRSGSFFTGACIWYQPYSSWSLYWQTGYFSTSTWVVAARTSVVAWPMFSAICMDNVWCPYTNSTWRTIWTNKNVLLDLYGITDNLTGASSGIQLLYISVLTWNYPISIVWPYGNTWWYVNRQVLFTGDVQTGFIWYQNILGNTGNTFLSWIDAYIYVNNVDMFWIDTVKPDNPSFFTGYVSNSGVWFQTFLLTVGLWSTGPSNAISGRHNASSIKDDEFKITAFSWYNTITQYEHASWYTTQYMDWLNSTGYVWSGTNDFLSGHYLTFNSPRSGYVYFIDRAGNTGQFFLNTELAPALTYTLKVWPQQVNLHSLSPLARQWLSGMLVKIAIYTGFDYAAYSGASDAVKTQIVLENLIYTWFLKTNAIWEGQFSGLNLGNFTGTVLVEWVFTLAGILTWVTFNQNGGTMDFTVKYPEGLAMGNFFNTTDQIWSLFDRTITIYSGFAYKHADYLSVVNNWVKNDSITAADAAILVTVLGEFSKYPLWTNQAWIFTGNNFFVDAPEAGSSLVPSDAKSTIPAVMQYHSYDLNADWDVSSVDFGIAADNLDLVSYKMPF